MSLDEYIEWFDAEQKLAKKLLVLFWFSRKPIVRRKSV